MEQSYHSCVAVIAELQQIPSLSERFYVAGGLVPWLLSGRDSGRLHGDIDLVVHEDDMVLFRDEMRACGAYRRDTDSLFFDQNMNRIDHGFDVIVADVIINIAPYCETPAGIVQRNATYLALGEHDGLVTVHMPQLHRAQYLTHSLWQSSMLGHYPLALVYATKQLSNRAKDQSDCAEILRIGVDSGEIAWYQQVLHEMQITVDS